MNILERVIHLIATSLEIPEERITVDTDIMNDLDADSLDLVELALTIEEDFQVEMDDDVVAHLRTVGDVVAELERL